MLHKNLYFFNKKCAFLKRLRFKRAQDWESPSTKRVSEGSNPASYPKTAVGIYGNFKKNSGSKNPERLDAVGFAPTASKVLGCYGGGRWIRTTEGIASRFTVCPLWPLGNSPIFNFEALLSLKPKPGEAGWIWRWSWWTDSNPRPADYKSAALPTELHQRIKAGAALAVICDHCAGS